MYSSGDNIVQHQHLQNGVSVAHHEEGMVEGANGETLLKEKRKKVKGEEGVTSVDKGPARRKLKKMQSVGSGLLGDITEARHSHDPFGDYEALGRFFGDGDGNSEGSKNFLVILAAVLLILARMSGNEAAAERKTKVNELLHGLEESLKAASTLMEGASGSLTAGIISGVTGLIGAGLGMAGSFWASKLKGQVANKSTQMEKLTNAEATELMRVELPGGGSNATTQSSAVEAIRAAKVKLSNEISKLDKKANTIGTVSEGAGRLSGSAAGIGSTASQMTLIQAQASQAQFQAVAQQQQQAFSIEDDWQRQMVQTRDTVLSIISEAVRAMAMASSSAFK